MVKKFTMLALSLFVMAGANAAGTGLTALNEKSQVKAEINSKKELKKDVAKNHLVTRAAGELPITEVITNPTGEYKWYSKNGVGEDSYYGQIDIVDTPVSIVFGENNEVYIQDLNSAWSFGTYAKGTLENGVITMQLPQTLFYWEDDGYGLDLVIFETQGTNYVTTNIDTVTFTYDETSGDIELVLPGEAYEYSLGVAYTIDGSWDSSEFYQEFTLVENVNSIPSGLETTEYFFAESDYGYNVEVANDGNYLYIKGMYPDMPNGIVIASIDGNKATITQDQTIGGYYGYWLYTKLFTINENAGDNQDAVSLAPANAVYTLLIDTENDVIQSDPDQNYYLGFNADLEELYYLYIFDPFMLYHPTSFEGTPADPYPLWIDPSYAEYYGFLYFGVYVPAVSTDGNILDSNSLYYRIFVDDEIMEFEPDEDYYMYMGLGGTTTEIPLNFDNGYDITKEGNTICDVGLYFEGFTTLGVQSVYRYNGVETHSNIIGVNVETGDFYNEVKSLLSAPVISEVYYDLNGRRVNNPSKGLYIVRSTMSDGKVVSKKVMVK